MERPSDELRRTRTYQTDENVRAIDKRYKDWTPERWTWAQASLDIGYLLGLIMRLERESQSISQN